MTTVLVNPSRKPAGRPTLRSATANMREFAKAVGASSFSRNEYQDTDDDKFGFDLKIGRRKFWVSMPGYRLSEVRDQVFAPRLWIGGRSIDEGSWTWHFAVQLLRSVTGKGG